MSIAAVLKSPSPGPHCARRCTNKEQTPPVPHFPYLLNKDQDISQRGAGRLASWVFAKALEILGGRVLAGEERLIYFSLPFTFFSLLVLLLIFY